MALTARKRSESEVNIPERRTVLEMAECSDISLLHEVSSFIFLISVIIRI